MITKEEVRSLYNECLNGNAVKNCSRDKCIDLIMAMEELYPKVNFGNSSTGFMNVDNIIKYQKLLQFNIDIEDYLTY